MVVEPGLAASVRGGHRWHLWHQIPAGAVLDHGEVAGKPFLHLIQAVSE